VAKVFRRRRRSASVILNRAEKLKVRADDPKDRDHPDWLRSRAEQMRLYALKKEKARIAKADERRKGRRAR